MCIMLYELCIDKTESTDIVWNSRYTDITYNVIEVIVDKLSWYLKRQLRRECGWNEQSLGKMTFKYLKSKIHHNIVTNNIIRNTETHASYSAEMSVQ